MEYMPDFKVHRPETIEDAVALYGSEYNARFLAGGTDMVVNIRRGIEQPATQVDLNAIEGFAAIEENAGGLVIGAGATLAPEEATGYFADGVELLFELDG